MRSGASQGRHAQQGQRGQAGAAAVARAAPPSARAWPGGVPRHPSTRRRGPSPDRLDRPPSTTRATGSSRRRNRRQAHRARRLPRGAARCSGSRRRTPGGRARTAARMSPSGYAIEVSLANSVMSAACTYGWIRKIHDNTPRPSVMMSASSNAPVSPSRRRRAPDHRDQSGGEKQVGGEVEDVGERRERVGLVQELGQHVVGDVAQGERRDSGDDEEPRHRWAGRLRTIPTTIAAAEPRPSSPQRYRW